MVELINYIAKRIVTKPDEVYIMEENLDNTIKYKLKVAKEDMCRIIGKEGKVIKSLRILANASSAKSKNRVTIEIVETW